MNNSRAAWREAYDDTQPYTPRTHAAWQAQTLWLWPHYHEGHRWAINAYLDAHPRAQYCDALEAVLGVPPDTPTPEDLHRWMDLN